MTEQVTGAIKHAVMGHGNDKIDQLKANIVEPSENTRITSDYGVKQNNTDHWLRVNSEDQTGASLLEDAFGREKVCYSIYRSFRFVRLWRIWILMVYQDSSLRPRAYS